MNKSDFHLHTDFSADSSMLLSELLPAMQKLGYSEIAITEHLDLLPQELTLHGIPPLQKYMNTIRHYRQKYPQIKLHCGIEVGDFQAVKPFADSILDAIGFDLVLGSVHFVPEHINVAIPMPKPLSIAQVIAYYEQNLALAESCNFHILAHLGVYKRYYLDVPDETHCYNIIEQIFRTIIRRNIALELNLACFRKPYHRIIPEPHLLEMYHKLGGRLVAIGSDSHEIVHLDQGYDLAAKMIQEFDFECFTLS